MNDLIIDERRLKWWKIFCAVAISCDQVHNIFQQQLNAKKFLQKGCSELIQKENKWHVPRELGSSFSRIHRDFVKVSWLWTKWGYTTICLRTIQTMNSDRKVCTKKEAREAYIDWYYVLSQNKFHSRIGQNTLFVSLNCLKFEFRDDYTLHTVWCRAFFSKVWLG